MYTMSLYYYIMIYHNMIWYIAHAILHYISYTMLCCTASPASPPR